MPTEVSETRKNDASNEQGVGATTQKKYYVKYTSSQNVLYI